MSDNYDVRVIETTVWHQGKSRTFTPDEIASGRDKEWIVQEQQRLQQERAAKAEQ